MSSAIQKVFTYRPSYVFYRKLVFVLFSQIQKKVECYKHKINQKGTKVRTFDNNVLTKMNFSGWSEPDFPIQTLLKVLPTSDYASRVLFDPINFIFWQNVPKSLKIFFFCCFRSVSRCKNFAIKNRTLPFRTNIFFWEWAIFEFPAFLAGDRFMINVRRRWDAPKIWFLTFPYVFTAKGKPFQSTYAWKRWPVKFFVFGWNIFLRSIRRHSVLSAWLAYNF